MARVSVDGGTDLRTPSQPKAQLTTINYAVDAAIMRYTADLSEVRISALWEAIKTAVPAVDSADDEKPIIEYIIVQLERLGFAASRHSGTFHRKHIDKKTPDEPQHIRLLSKPELLDPIPLSYPSIWEKMRRNEFPRSREVGGRSFWVEAEIVAWIAALPVRALKGEPGARPSLAARSQIANKSKVGDAKPSRLITNKRRSKRPSA